MVEADLHLVGGRHVEQLLAGFNGAGLVGVEAEMPVGLAGKDARVIGGIAD